MGKVNKDGDYSIVLEQRTQMPDHLIHSTGVN